MTNDELNPNDECATWFELFFIFPPAAAHSSFIIRISSFPDVFPETLERFAPLQRSVLTPSRSTRRAADPEAACSPCKVSYPGGRVAPPFPQTLAQQTES